MNSNQSKISCKRGFTLIELLVVVLIIGISAAVAVPQYQVAVKKAELARLIPLLDSLYKAEEAYFLANGDYTPDITALDVDLPSQGCTYTPTNTSGVYACNNYYAGVFDGPVNAQVGIGPSGGRILAYLHFFKPYANYEAQKGDIMCFSRGEIGRKVCKTLGSGTEVQYPSSGWDYVYKLAR